jgi:hypothetical protein
MLDELNAKPVPYRRARHKVGRPLSLQKRAEVVKKYTILGNLHLVAELCGVSYAQAKVWKNSQWWKDLELEFRVAKRIEQDNKLQAIVERALDAVSDRLENGDHVLVPGSDEFKRKPVTLRDATNAATSLMQRQAVLEKMSSHEQIAEERQTIAEQLSFLANEFAKFNNRSKAGAQTIEYKEIEDDALHDEWEEGLQEGSGEIYEQAGSSQEEDGAERGSESNGEERVSA